MNKILSHFKKPKIEVFVRYCYYSNASVNKARHPSFTHFKCHQNLLETADLEKVNMTFLLDIHHGKEKDHFIQKQTQFPIVEIDGGTETKAFLAMLDYVVGQPFSPDTIIYFLEDDYIHRRGWADVLLEGFSLKGIDYVTLYDHRDKYFFEQYDDLKSQLFHTKSCHWRTTPSTTNTYAMRLKTLKRDYDVHREFSLNRDISADHEKFCKLGEQGATLISSIPGYSSHMEPEFASPCHAWDNYL